MKNSPYTPDLFMKNLYDNLYVSPYSHAKTKEDVLKIGEDIRNRAKEIFALDKIPGKIDNLNLVACDAPLDFGKFTMQKYSVEICKGLVSLVYLLVPKKIKNPVPGVVALCGHGYGVRQILGISRNGRKKRIRYFDNYQKNFAVELAERGCVVAAPELFGFGEARLKKDLKKPFYISSCDELSHHLLPYGLTVASMRVYQAVVCANILFNDSRVDKEKLSCMGISGGGLTALYASVIDERFKKIVISGYVNTFKDSIFSRWHCPDNYIPRIIETGEIYDFASALAPRDLLVESGIKDKLFPIEASETAHEKIKQVYALAGAKDKFQTDVFNGKHSVNGKKSFEFLSR